MAALVTDVQLLLLGIVTVVTLVVLIHNFQKKYTLKQNSKARVKAAGGALQTPPDGNTPRPHPSLHAHRSIAALIRTIGVVAWPFVLLCTLNDDDARNPVVLLPIAWNMCVWLVDIHIIHHSTSASELVPPSVRLEPTMFCGLAFGLCGFLNARIEGKYSYLFMYAVLGCIMFVLPQTTLVNECIEHVVIENVQRVLLYYCTGLILAGVALTTYNLKTLTQ